jgi:hypothetical protein
MAASKNWPTMLQMIRLLNTTSANIWSLVGGENSGLQLASATSIFDEAPLIGEKAKDTLLTGSPHLCHFNPWPTFLFKIKFKTRRCFCRGSCGYSLRKHFHWCLDAEGEAPMLTGCISSFQLHDLNKLVHFQKRNDRGRKITENIGSLLTFGDHSFNVVSPTNSVIINGNS